MNKLALGFMVFICSNVVAQDAQENCATLISLSKVTSNIVSSNSEFDQAAANFCSEYSKGTSASSSTSFGASFKFISASYGQENASAESIASKVCSSSNRSTAKADAYRQYIETIAPGAYGAYNACINARNSLRFKVNTGSMLPREFAITANYVPTTSGAQAKLLYTASDGVTCGWNNSSAKAFTLTSGVSATLNCKRIDQTKPGFVNVINTTGSEEITIPWKRYNQMGDPVDTIASLENQISKLQVTAAALQTSTTTAQAQITSNTNSIAMLTAGTRFSLSSTNSCPTGWDMVGLLLVGADPSKAANLAGAGMDPGGLAVGAAMVGAWPGFHPSLCIRKP